MNPTKRTGWILLIVGGSINIFVAYGNFYNIVLHGFTYSELGFPAPIFYFVWVSGIVMLVRGFAIVRKKSKYSATPLAGNQIQSSSRKATKKNAASSIFISYRRSDSVNITGRIYDRLTQQFGKDKIFKDVDNIPLGVDFRQHLDQAVGKCDVVLVVIGDTWLSIENEDNHKRLFRLDDFVRIEIDSALLRNIPVIPVLVRGASMPKESDLPSSIKSLAYRNGIPVRPDPDFHKDIDRLISGIQNSIPSD